MNIQIYHGNALHLLQSIDMPPITMIFADVPYSTTKAKWDILINPDLFWNRLKAVRQAHTSIHLMTGDYPFYKIANVEEYRYTNYWDKKFGTNFTQVKRQPLFVIESIEVYYEKLPNYTPQMIDRDKPIRSGKRAYARVHSGTDVVKTYNAPQKTYTQKFPNNLIQIPRKLGQKSIHPTQKPVELLEYLIKTYTQEGDTILDPVMGSGTTCIAARNLNRKCIGIELQENYFNLAKQRIFNE